MTLKNRTIHILIILLLLHVGWWSLPNYSEDFDPAWKSRLNALSFSPYRSGQSPLDFVFPTHEEIWEDMRLLKGHTKGVRTYSSLDGMEIVPGVAAALDLNVTAGAWIDHRPERNEREIYNLIDSSNRYRSIKRVIVGNEAILRGDLRVSDLIRYIEKVRDRVAVPVSTAEPWHVWIKHPELAEHVDFISIHVLPYWERISVENAVPWVIERYEQVRRAFPDKPIFIAEVGWPSAGERRGSAKPSRDHAERFFRRFLHESDRLHLDYNVVEAFDQPWKKPLEGIVGAHWGIFDVDRNPKYILEKPFKTSTTWIWMCLVSLFGLLPAIAYLRTYRHHTDSARLLFTVIIQGSASVFIWLVGLPFQNDFLVSELLVWALMLPLQIGLILVVLTYGFEMSEMLWNDHPKRRFSALKDKNSADLPKVSIHVPICREPPAMVIETLNGLADLDYPNLEVLVIDNNTPELHLWEPIESHCRRLGAQFRFFHIEKLPGYKAGALNFALRQTDKEAEIVAVVDSDYKVRPDWLKSLVPYFSKPATGIVQAPQDHRLWKGNRFKTICNWEYHGFFEIGMVHRNERNAIIQHGTMTLIRKAALRAAGGWSQWCICEDAELGLRVLGNGWEAIYVKESFGKGLVPDSFAAYKRQRFRWAYGAVQILKRHWKLLLPWSRDTRLTLAQKYHFAAGWLPWIGDGINDLVTWAWVVWISGMLIAPKHFGPPISVLIYPVFWMFAFKWLHFLSLYRARVGCSFVERMGAALAGMALTHTVARAVIQGIFTSQMPFLRTPKCKHRPAWIQAIAMAQEEALMAILLWFLAANLWIFYGSKDPESGIWIAAVLVQSLPYLSAVSQSVLSVVPEERGKLRTDVPEAATVR